MPTLSIFNPTSTLGIISTVLGGLGLFLYGIDLMSSSLKSLSGNKLKMLIEKATNNIFISILTGFIVTVLIQSSSATTVIVIGLISAGFMNLKQALGVMMGANIGSTVTAFLIGLKISDYALFFVAIGTIFILFITNKKFNLSGNIIFGFGVLFIGLELMSSGLSPLAEKPWFEEMMITLAKSPILGVTVGTILTAIIQSSGASIGILQQIFHDGNIALSGALAVLLGCNIGTTITAILASIKSPKEAKQASLFHLIFNVFGTVIFLIFFNGYVNIFKTLENKFFGLNNKLTIAFAHIFFNAVTTILVLAIIKYFVIILQYLIKEKTNEKQATLINKLNHELIKTSPVLALESAKAVILEMGNLSLEMVKLARIYQNENNLNYFTKILELEDTVDLYEKTIHDYLMEMQAIDLPNRYKDAQMLMLDTIRDFERISDHSVNLAEFYKNRYEWDCPIIGKAKENLDHYFDIVLTQVNDAIICFKNNDKKIAKRIIEIEKEVDRLEKYYRRSLLIYNNELTTDENPECKDTHYVDILANLERIGDHCNNIAENVIDPHYLSSERINPSI